MKKKLTEGRKLSFPYLAALLAGVIAIAATFLLSTKQREQPEPTVDDPFPKPRNIPDDNDEDLGTKIDHAVEAIHEVNEETKHEDDISQA